MSMTSLKIAHSEEAKSQVLNIILKRTKTCSDHYEQSVKILVPLFQSRSEMSLDL